MASTELNGAIYALGGFDGVNYLTYVHDYLNVIILDRIHAVFLCLDVAFTCSACEYRTGERFDPREGIWREIAPMSVRRGSLTAACLNDNL